MRLLVTGTSGQLAQSLLEAGHEADIDVFAIRRPQFDLTIPGTIRAALIDAAPDIVVNAAAYTAVDKAESEPELAHAVNADGSAELARQCETQGIALVHISTDYVFDGTKASPYVEDDPTGPENAYGRSKLAGEIAVTAACERHIVLRTAWVHSPFGANFVKTMLRLAGGRPALRVVDDQWGSPTYAPHLARTVLAIAAQLPGKGEGSNRLATPWGIYHAAGAGETTWCGFAREIFQVSSQLGGPSAEVEAITTTDYPTPAKRPGNSRLDCGKLERRFGITLPDWREGARQCVERLLQDR
jgi:dTDP-4-dehydrorhamnose reductase